MCLVLGIQMQANESTGWASLSTVADMLNAADALSRIEFYVTKYDNKPVELNCRIWHFPGLSKADVEALSAELNVAIAPVVSSLQKTLQNKAANQLRRFL
jgi:hypothetical protein